ncbi:MAG: hypothetical protein Q8O86_12085 [Dehalococcoidia bacterium]|nr:hypothetical protein [Dehalococcoidia bacterium]
MKGGARKEPRASRIAIFEKGWPSRKATLYVYVEADPSLSDDLLEAACQEASRKWQQSRLSATGALQEAAAAGMQALFRGGGAHANGPGITCAVLQPAGAYLAQAGATRAYILGPQVCRRVATSSPWDPNHVDLREEPLPLKGALLLAPSVLEEALALLQGGLPPREVQRLIRAWLQDKPELAALVVGMEAGREVALGAGVQAEAMLDRKEDRGEKIPLPQPDSRLRPSALRQARKTPVKEVEAPVPVEPSFPILRALRLPLLVIAALLAVLVLGGIAWYLPSRQKGEDEARLVYLLDKAGKTRQEASLYSDPALARNLLAEAESLVNEASTIRAKDKRVVSLKQEIDNELDRVNTVIRPTSTTLLADLAKLGGSQSSPSRVVVDSNNLYVLDKGAGRVYKFLLDASGQSLLNVPNNVLIRKGDVHGGTPLVDVWEAVWMPAGPLRASPSLLVLGSQGTLIDYRPEKGLQVLPLRGSQAWLSFRGARGFNGNLYVLDPPSGQVWRYIPTSTGYDSEPRGILEGAQIEDAVDLAVDGNIYVLAAKGTVWQFAGGPPKTFQQNKLDRPLTSPVALFSIPSTRFVYVADRGNARIVAFNKEGEFRFQIKGEAMEGIQSLSVDEEKGLLYVASGQKVFAASIAIPKQ